MYRRTQKNISEDRHGAIQVMAEVCGAVRVKGERCGPGASKLPRARTFFGVAQTRETTSLLRMPALDVELFDSKSTR